MQNKAKFPFIVLDALQPWFQYESKYFNRVFPTSDEFLVRYVSAIFPEFYFQITKVAAIENQGVVFQAVRCPGNATNTAAASSNVPSTALQGWFNIWFDLITSYEKLLSPYDKPEDSLVEDYTKEFFDEFELLDEDADSKPYDLKMQIVIDKIADTVIKQIGGYQGVISDDEKQTIITEAQELKNTQTSLPKKEAAKKSAKLLARIRKVSLELLKEVFKDLVKEGITSLLKGDYNGMITNLLN